MKKAPRIVLGVVLALVGVVVLAGLLLVGRWIIRHEDPLAFLPDRYTACFQVPSLRVVYDDWLNLPAADAILGRPDLAPYRGAIADARGLALTRSPLVSKLMDVHADVVLLPDGRLLAVLDLGWRGIVSPLARVVGPVLGVKGFTFTNEAGTPLYSYSIGGATIHAALIENVAVLSPDEEVVKQALARRAAGTGLAARASRELLDRLHRRNNRAIRVVVDTARLSSDLLGASGAAAQILGALQLPGESMLDAEARGDRLSLSAALPVSAGIPELAKVLAAPRAPIGVLRYVPSTAYLLTISNLAPLGDLYRLAAAVEGGAVRDAYAKADSGARSILGVGIDDLVFSWVGSEVGMFSLPGSNSPVYFARITDRGAFTTALAKLTGSIVAGKDSSLVLDGVRIDRLSVPWYVTAVLDALGVNVPEPYFLTRGDYLFASMDAQNLSAVVKTGDAGDNIARVGSAFTRLTQGIPADPSALVWYDSSRGLPFFVSPTGTLADLLRVYGSGAAVVRASPTDLRATLVTEGAPGSAAQPLAGFPLTVPGVGSGDLLAFRFADGGPARFAWLKDRATLALADAAGSEIAEAKLESDSVLVPERAAAGVLSAVWAVSPGGTVWRFGPKLQPLGPFPVATGIVSPMPPTLIDGKLALFSRADSALVLVGPDGSRRALGEKLEAPLFAPPSVLAGRIAFYPRSFDAKVHLGDLAGDEAAGWPVSASGISSCSPLIVPGGGTAGSFIVTFLTQAGELDAWDPSGAPVPSFPVRLPGVYYATPAFISVDGRPVLVALSRDGALSEVGLDGVIVRQTTVPDIDGKTARIMPADLFADGRQEILLYGSGAFIAGYDAYLRPLPGFPLKGATRPQVLDINHDGTLDLVTAGLDGKIYAYAMGRSKE